MNVTDLLTQLSYGELSNLSMAETPGEIRASSIPQVVIALNEALLRLHSRFVLVENDVLIQMFRHITNYHLTPRFSIHEEPRKELYPYILDSPRERFLGDVVKVMAVYDSLGRSIPLNDAEQAFSVFTPQLGVVQVPRPIPGQSLSIVYQARHAKITADDLTQEIVLPDVLDGALRAYVAYKIYSQMNNDTSTAKANEHMSVYEAICQEIMEHDLVDNSISTTNSNFEQRGWC